MSEHILTILIKANTNFDIAGHMAGIAEIEDVYKLRLWRVQFLGDQSDIDIIIGKYDKSTRLCDFENGIIGFKCCDITYRIKCTDDKDTFMLSIAKY